MGEFTVAPLSPDEGAVHVNCCAPGAAFAATRLWH